MLRLKKIDSTGEPKIFLSQIKWGSTFYGKVSRDDKEKQLFLWGRGALVDLNDPSRTWIVPSPQDFPIFEYRPVDIVGEVVARLPE